MRRVNVKIEFHFHFFNNYPCAIKLLHRLYDTRFRQAIQTLADDHQTIISPIEVTITDLEDE